MKKRKMYLALKNLIQLILSHDIKILLSMPLKTKKKKKSIILIVHFSS